MGYRHLQNRQKDFSHPLIGQNRRRDFVPNHYHLRLKYHREKAADRQGRLVFRKIFERKILRLLLEEIRRFQRG